MGMEMKLQMRMSQRLVMTPMLQQAIKMLPMTRLELIQTIRGELDDNPLLEELANEAEDEAERQEKEAEESQTLEKQEDPLETKAETVFEEDTNLAEKEQKENQDEVDWDAYIQAELYEGGTGEGYVERPSLDNTLKNNQDLNDHLSWQLNCSALTDEESRLGALIIGNTNNEGYLEQSLVSLAEEAHVNVEDIEDALALVQSFDPPGVCAQDLRECLLLQAFGNGMKGTLMETLIRDHLDLLDERNYAKLARSLNVDVDDVLKAVRMIRELDPKPGLQFNSEETHYITPDIFVVKVDDEYQVYLNDDGIPRLRINNYYKSILKNKNESQKVTREYVENKFRSALWMIKSIEQRRQTMLKVGRSLCKFQREFLDSGINYLKPLILRNVADDIEMHESTVSRVTTNKYIHTPQGLFELKFFFHSSVSSYLGNDLSSVRVKEMIKNICKEEDPAKPYTDDQIVKLLQHKDVKIARRTVTKYRKELRIPATSKRRRRFL
ncbi:RNA polymerase sigma-54 factor RpoN [hydrothermal vent metagenome]|uniref:RNA polymerase sigma-54 factor RpoN n=1 Tax=hydrothermal vent metagenome TaxID=652676 RepID=A0A3B1BWN3_9ZZZZ